MLTQPAVPPIGEEHRSLNQQVYAALLAAIADRRMGPGQRLVLDELAAQLKVSRTPIRVALTRLAAEGLVQPTGRMGFSVTRLSSQQLLELYDVRLMCESYAVEKGMAAVTPELLERLGEVIIPKDQHPDSLSPAERLAHVLKDQEFHRLIVALAGNPTLSDLYERMNIHIHAMRVGPLPVSPLERREMNNAEHSAIIAALRAADVAAAKAAIADHVASSARRAASAMEMDQAGGATI